MKPKFKILRYDSDQGQSFLAIRKNGYVIDIACSNKNSLMYDYSDDYQPSPSQNPFFKNSNWIKVIEIQAKDLALYTHWPVHTKEFWDLLNET